MTSMPMSNQALDPTIAAGAQPTQTPRPRTVRRHYLIDRRRQLRTAALTSGLAILLLLVVNIAFHLLRSTQSMALSSTAPQLEAVLEEQDANFSRMLIGFSAVFVLGVFVLTIAETHRTAGAIYAVKNKINMVREGDYQVTLRLRPRDTLLDLSDPFNEMVLSLRNRALSDADELDRLAEEAASSPSEGNPELAAQLHDFAMRKRELGAS